MQVIYFFKKCLSVVIFTNYLFVVVNTYKASMMACGCYHLLKYKLDKLTHYLCKYEVHCKDENLRET